MHHERKGVEVLLKRLMRAAVERGEADVEGS